MVLSRNLKPVSVPTVIDSLKALTILKQWSTIQIVLILAVKHGFTLSQCDITAAFIHAMLPDDEMVYIDQPRGFCIKPNHMLWLWRSLHGLKQVLKQGLQQSIHDPCLFMTSNMIVIVYVDDLLIFTKSDELINMFISSMQQEEICLCKEGTAEGYFGVNIKTVDGPIYLTQPSLS